MRKHGDEIMAVNCTVAYDNIMNLPRLIPTAVCTVVITLSGFSQAAIAQDQASSIISPQSEQEELDELIQALGAGGFVERQKAMQRLIEIGGASIPKLQQAMESPSREVRFRASKVLELVKDRDFERSLQLFLRAENGGDAIPGWSALKGIVGEEGDARRILVEMHRAEPKIMRLLEVAPKTVSRLVSERTHQIQRTPQNLLGKLSSANMAAILLATKLEGVTLSDLNMRYVASLMSHQLFSKELVSRDPQKGYIPVRGVRSDMFRKLVASVLLDLKGTALQIGLSVALRYDIQDGLVAADRALNDKNLPCHVRQYALMLYGKFGNPSHIIRLMQLLDDASFCGTTQTVDKIKYSTQIRDVALATIILIAKADHKKFGFDRIRLSGTSFTLNTIGFADDETRKKAKEAWLAHWAESKEAILSSGSK